MSGEDRTILNRLSSTLQAAEEGIVHTAQGVAEGLKHGTSQLVHGGKVEVEEFSHGVRESNESIPRSTSLSGSKIISGKQTSDNTPRPAAEVELGVRPPKPVSERLSEVTERGREAIEKTREGISNTVQSTIDRGKELAGGVSREVGHATGAAKSMDPDQNPSEDTGKTQSTALSDTLQREYEAGQQEQMAPAHKSTFADEALSSKVTDEAKQVAEGAARQYGKASEHVKMKVEEGAKEAHHRQ